jgi:hypothetical protein
MRRRTAAPFLQLSEAARLDGWVYELNHGSPLLLGDTFPDWDYGAALKVSRRVRLDHAAAAEELGLAANGFDLALVVEAGSGAGALPREIIHRVREPLVRDASDHRVEFELPSRWMSTQLSLRTTIVLAADAEALNPLAPTRQGSRLWSDRIVSRLEGHDPRFPMEVVSFNRLFRGRPHQHAPWHLRWNAADLERDFYSAVRLYLNEDQPHFVDRVQEQDPLTLQALMGDVVSQMCESALRSLDGLDRLESAEETTLGGQIRHWLLRPFSSVSEAGAALEQRPGDFRAAILASVGFDA